MRILDLALKDILQVVRDRRSLLFMVLMPLAFTVFMGFAFGGGAEEDVRISLAWVDRDGGVPAARFWQLVEAGGWAQLVSLDEADALSQVQSGELDALVVVPAGFSGSLFVGSPLKVEVITSGGVQEDLVRAPVSQAWLKITGAAEAARMIVETAESPVSSGGPAAHDAALLDVFARVLDEADRPALRVEVSPYGELERVTNPYNQSSPGMLVMFAIFGLVSSSSLLTAERRNKTFQRLITTSLSRGSILAGHGLAIFILVLAQEALLVLFGQLALGVDYLREPLAVLLIMVCAAIWLAGLGVLIGVAAREEEQVILYTMATMFLFSALGGAMFPLESTGRVFAQIGQVLPSAWAVEGFQNILIRGQGLGSALLPAAVLLGYALLFFTAGAWLFRRTDA